MSGPWDDYAAPTASAPWEDYGGTPAPAKAAPARKSTVDYGLSDLIASKMTLGLADKAAAAGQAIGHSVGDLVHGKATSLGDNYHTAIGDVDAAKAKYQGDHPVLDWGTLPLNLYAPGKAAGAVVDAVRAGGKGLFGAGVKSGTKAGLVAGVGQSRGDYGDQAGQIAATTGASALTAGVASRYVPTALAAAANYGRPAIRKVAQVVAPRSELATSAADNGLQNAPPTARAAQSYIAARLAADGTDPAALAAQMAAAKARGVPFAPMDSGPNMQRAAAAISRKSGPGSKIVSDAVASRQAAQGERVQGAISRDLGPTVGTATEAQRLEQAAKTAADPLYKQAYAHGVVDNPTIEAMMMHPEMQSAKDMAARIHAHDTFMANARGEAPPAPLVMGTNDVRALDYTKRALDRKIEAAYSGDSAAKSSLPELKDLRAELLKQLDATVPAYKQARAAYAGPMAMSEALQAGKAAVNKTGDDIAAETSALGPAELEHYKLGLRSALSDAVDARVGGADKMQALIGTPKKQKALQQVFGGKGLDNFLATLGNEGATSKTFKRVTGNSLTAENTLDDTDLSGVAHKASAALHLAKGNPIPAFAQAWSAVSDKLGGEAGQKMRAQVASLITETNPEIIGDILASVAAKQNARGVVGSKAVPVIGAAAGRASGGLLSGR